MEKTKIEKIVSIALMLFGGVFFVTYLWWGANYNTTNDEWGIGIWLVAVGTFLTGAITFYDVER